jgi:hypothetical protein
VAVIGRSRQGAADCNDRHTWPSLPSPALSHQGSYLGLSCRLERRRRTIIVNGATQTTPDWSAWSQEAVRLMQERDDAWIRRYGLEGRRYQWSLDEAQLRFTSESDEATCDICVIGSVSRSEGTFSWGVVERNNSVLCTPRLGKRPRFRRDSRSRISDQPAVAR